MMALQPTEKKKCVGRLVDGEILDKNCEKANKKTPQKNYLQLSRQFVSTNRRAATV